MKIKLQSINYVIWPDAAEVASRKMI
jgi:hypothetical protein